jgi:hypothetical protein
MLYVILLFVMQRFTISLAIGSAFKKAMEEFSERCKKERITLKKGFGRKGRT